MQVHHLIAGFSDIKSDFLIKTRTTKQLENLKLWFSFKDNILYVHDYDDHNTNMVLARYNVEKNLWTVYLRSTNYGEKVVQYIIGQSCANNIAENLNEKYRSYGFIPIRDL